MTLPLSTGHLAPTYWWHPPAEHPSDLSSALLCLHGAGDVGLCWAQVARLTSERHVVVAADLHAAGLQVERLLPYVLALLHAVSQRLTEASLILCGHSLGGAVAARAAQEALKMRLPVRGVVLLEAVEGTAREALPRSIAWMQAKPQSFDSLEVRRHEPQSLETRRRSWKRHGIP